MQLTFTDKMWEGGLIFSVKVLGPQPPSHIILPLIKCKNQQFSKTKSFTATSSYYFWDAEWLETNSKLFSVILRRLCVHACTSINAQITIKILFNLQLLILSGQCIFHKKTVTGHFMLREKLEMWKEYSIPKGQPNQYRLLL